MTEDGSSLVLDGNAAAGLLRQIFATDVTAAQIQCGSCGTAGAVGASLLYAARMGAILRCANCGDILMRVAQTPHGRWLDMRGACYLRF